ncbi:tRNA guanosine(34) transglycosylase Tgt [Rhodohalobacter barkolensis]|uniref:Queuine tRNA-ribosyltransferase n=1 Tax=Rhodohalobacter barkolensis TaxID=2053187 RepID=A0A2N0VFG2_9BACT|nr:tRNA guanosine(34) transglycosylase Tgt [Rhodohalobacter barkolensis]PKD42929.1 tRNA guanosine(34) transglycosylase Tgt [Rhodohalobacter barkolensis]
MFTLQKTSSKTKARLGKLTTDHGTIETPIFMPVGTLGTVKAVNQDDLSEKIKAQIILGNTYHLYLRPGNKIIQDAGGLHKFIGWDKPILTDSGGYQIFSLAEIRNLKEKGATFQSHIDGSKHLFTPENVVGTQRILGSDILMILDECPPYPAEFDYVKNSMELTHRWAKRGREEFLKTDPLYGHKQFQFGIVQGGVHKDLRKESSEYMASLDFEGLAIGGLSVGEPTDLMYEISDFNTDYLPENKPRYLMGVGTPANLLQNVAFGIDMFDCVMPTRNARNGMIFTRNGKINVRNAKWKHHHKPLDPDFPSELCQRYNMSYIHHLIRSNEILGLQLTSKHNLTFYLWLMERIREQIKNDTYHEWYSGMMQTVDQKI